GEPLLETLRTFRTPSDSAVVYKVIGNRKMEPAEAKELVEKGRIGPLDGFVSKNGKPYSASLVLGDEGKVKFDFGGPSAAAAEENPEELDKLEPVGRCPKTGGDLFETANSFLVRVKENGSASIPFKLSRKILEQEIPREQVLKLLETGKTDVLPSFRSKRTKRQFAASLVLKPGNKIGFEFPPREPGKGKGRKPAAKAKTTAKADSE
ncbi:MAG: DNA topoisomerase III, partial [Puniceicoccaceae bacterium]